ncbi:PEPxxWA-CTERM sorting domain-containing protein [Sandaracinobacteroides saxicola]|uniref:PEPxxWA-CTERM sorting domain-containing protein n=1 Tax=Sandaracinobacteroides saxicola TaxID=2759707 RepID=A0A7G5IKY9_9SPHN|nr:PEPxxWA-CTERM sorting domain-containing protein [Sandaracinobacteroides saxicola]QMW24031.1 PEPxxWA-CTERM sorting domain-containing protein [Sandaracinobacteroides saxicola]
MKAFLTATGAAMGLAAALAAPASANTQTGIFNGMAYEARNMIVGMTPTASNPQPGTGGGDPLFFPSSNKSGVAALIMDYGAQGRFICTGSLLSDRVTVLTAAHCVNPRAGITPTTTAYFFTNNPNERTPFSVNARAVVAQQQSINAGYTGQVIDHNDIAMLRLSQGVYNVIDADGTKRAIDAYNLYAGNDLTGLGFNVAGYGGRSTIGGAFGSNAQTGWLREGDNTYDYRMGDPLFSAIPGNGWQTVFPSNPNIAHSWLSDFDNGRAANDMACRIAQASNLAGAAGVVFCNTGVGAREVGVAGGDSGGPQFIGGAISSVTSYGLSFGTAWGDCRAGLNSSCGEFSGYVPTYLHRDYIAAFQAVPEPATWAMMIIGFGMVGSALRRRAAVAA